MISTSITFSLDLSTTWEASKPNYTLMTTEGPTDYLITSTLISSDNVWIMISNATGSVLRLDGTVPAWSEQAFAANTLSKDKGLVAATDPITGSIYIVNGGLENGAKRLFTFNKDLNLFKEINQLVPMESGFAGAWSVERKRMYIHGGIQSTVLQSVLYEFLPSNDAPLIRFVPSTGDAPTARQGHCMVSAYGGAKMVVFGGFGDSTTPLGDIYILNTTSSTWTKGTDGGLSAARAHTACAVTNDLFVAWGGTQDGVNTITSNITIVYNLKTNQWQSTYSPLPYVASSPPTATASENGTGAGLKPTGTGTATNATSRGSNLGAIIGGVVGGLSVIAIVVALFVYRKRQAKNSTNNTSSATTRPRSTHKEINSPDFNNDQSPYGEAPVSAVAPPPQYNIFQPTTTTSAATGPGYQLAYIDHFQQRHPQDRQQQQEQEQEQTFIHAPQTVPCAPSSPVNSSYTTSTTNSSPVIKYSTKPRITGSSGTELFQVETRHPHTPGNGQFFADIQNADRHPHT
ncbi:hypothetical protein BGZ97_004092 [Linnemannia gamsii]|uniref:Galactose oxidase n=1 Tax=Linnemannia gamsii TaxID=64522 RepID=A0A9P6RL69_9FUNG|nr:hypothetical protein BGZ97_004092 [Linnemannia gamsii]